MRNDKINVKSEDEKESAIHLCGMKRVFTELWTLLGRRYETPVLVLQLEGCFIGRRVNEYVWLVRKCRCSDVTKQSPYFLLIPDDMVIERELKSLDDMDYFESVENEAEYGADIEIPV